MKTYCVAEMPSDRQADNMNRSVWHHRHNLSCKVRDQNFRREVIRNIPPPAGITDDLEMSGVVDAIPEDIEVRRASPGT